MRTPASLELLERAFGGMEDMTGPPRLNQGELADCFFVAAVNQVAATPAGEAHLRSLVQSLGDNLYEVIVHDKERPAHVVLQGPGPVGAAGDNELRVLERAAAVHYGVGATDMVAGERDLYEQSALGRGGFPATAFSMLGLDAVELSAQDALQAAARGDADAVVIASRAVAPGSVEEAALNAYGLVPSHAYEYGGTRRDDATGEELVFLRNPWGTGSPAPIPSEMVPRVLASGTLGRLRR